MNNKMTYNDSNYDNITFKDESLKLRSAFHSPLSLLGGGSFSSSLGIFRSSRGVVAANCSNRSLRSLREQMLNERKRFTKSNKSRCVGCMMDLCPREVFGLSGAMIVGNTSGGIGNISAMFTPVGSGFSSMLWETTVQALNTHDDLYTNHSHSDYFHYIHSRRLLSKREWCGLKKKI